MKRSPFKRKPPAPYAKPERIPVVYARLTVPVNMARISQDVTSIPKESSVRSEEYRRLVAALPCKHCQIQGFSQAAHVPPDGKGIKQDDRQIFALCCDRPGAQGCHPKFDQYKLFPHAVAMEIATAWAADTRRQIEARGDWPANLPKWTPND